MFYDEGLVCYDDISVGIVFFVVMEIGYWG